MIEISKLKLSQISSSDSLILPEYDSERTNLLSEIWIQECRQMSTLTVLSLLRCKPAQNLFLPPSAFTSPKQPTLFPQNKSGQRELCLGNTNMVKVCFVFPTLYFKFLFRDHQQIEKLVIASKLRWVELKLYLI